MEFLSEHERHEEGVVPHDLELAVVRELFDKAVKANELAESLPDIWE